MEWYVQWTQAFSAFSSRNDYPTAIELFKQLDEHPVCRNNLVGNLLVLLSKIFQSW